MIPTFSANGAERMGHKAKKAKYLKNSSIWSQHAHSQFGRLWERKYTNYGGPGARGHLCGYVTGNRKADFREQIGIYVLSDKDLAPIYIGQAGRGQRRLLNRLNQHETDHLWNRWEYFSWFGFRRVNQSGSLSAHDDVSKIFRARGELLLNEIEGALITALEPKLNKQGDLARAERIP